MVNIDNFKHSYEFFNKMKAQDKTFKKDDLIHVTDWSKSTVQTYFSKKWASFLVKEGQNYTINDNFCYSEAEYIRMMSQVNKYSSNPFKPELPVEVEGLVLKAKEAATLAIDIYNRPMTSFRSQGFIVMMIIAWTSLFHSIFENENIDYFYKENDGTYKTVDGDKKAWELSTCIDKYNGKISAAIKENIKFFISIRNKIEHRFIPALDLDLCGECQSMLINFETMITNIFGSYFALSTALSFPLQVVTSKPSWQTETSVKFQGEHYEELKEYITSYRNSIPFEIYSDLEFSYRVYLIPKVGNHIASSDTAIEFIKYDPTHPEEFENIKKEIALIKDRKIQVANQGKLKPKTICEEVSKRLNKKFNMNDHTKAWKFYSVRNKGYQPEGCKIEFCQFDEAHNDYVYTSAWIDFLVKNLSNEDEYKRFKAFK